MRCATETQARPSDAQRQAQSHYHRCHIIPPEAPAAAKRKRDNDLPRSGAIFRTSIGAAGYVVSASALPPDLPSFRLTCGAAATSGGGAKGAVVGPFFAQIREDTRWLTHQRQRIVDAVSRPPRCLLASRPLGKISIGGHNLDWNTMKR